MSRVIPLLLEAGHEVIGVDNGQKWGKNPASRNYDLMWADCTSNSLKLAMRGADYVIQAAATLYGVIGFHRFPADILGNDLAVQRNVLECALQAGVRRVVYISSSMVYDRSNRCVEDGEDLALPMTDYGLSKLVCERLLQAYHKQHGMPFTIWRPFNAFDPTEQAEYEPGIAHVIPDLWKRIVTERQNPVELLGDGEQIRCFCHINEIAEVIAKHSFSQSTLNKTLNVGRKQPVSMKQLAQEIYSLAMEWGLLPESSDDLRFTYRPAPATDVRERVGEFSKLEAATGWKSKTPLGAMIQELCFHHQPEAMCK